MTNLAVKLDVDTLRGYREGVPRLLDLWAARVPDAKMSIFFSFGPDNSGKAIRRIFRKGFISKMMRTKAPSTYGWRTLLYGTLLPAPLIVPSDPKIFERACAEGHDCGVHAWDHVLVQDKLSSISEGEFRELYGRAADLFEKLSGSRPESYAAAASLSGALDVARLLNDNPEGEFSYIRKQPAVEFNTHDLFFLADKAAKSSGPKPRLYAWCGTEDFLYNDNVKFAEFAKKTTLDFVYEEGPGDHSWGYWDIQIQAAMKFMFGGK